MTDSEPTVKLDNLEDQRKQTAAYIDYLIEKIGLDKRQTAAIEQHAAVCVADAASAAARHAEWEAAEARSQSYRADLKLRDLERHAEWQEVVRQEYAKLDRIADLLQKLVEKN